MDDILIYNRSKAEHIGHLNSLKEVASGKVASKSKEILIYEGGISVFDFCYLC